MAEPESSPSPKEASAPDSKAEPTMKASSSVSNNGSTSESVNANTTQTVTGSTANNDNGNSTTNATSQSDTITTNTSTSTTTTSSNANGSSTSSTSGSLYISNLKPTVSESYLYDMFEKYGPVKSVRVAKDPVTKASLGYAFVNFNSSESQQNVMDAIKKDADLFEFRVVPFHGDIENGKEHLNLIVRNLDPTIESKALVEIFEAFGNVISCKVSRDEFGNSRGIAYVLFEDEKAAEEAVKIMNGVLMNDRKVYVGYYISKRERMEKSAHYTSLYVKNIDHSVTEDEFVQCFAKYGTITTHSLPMDDSGLHPKGYGFVNFQTHEGAVAAVEALNGFELKGKKMSVSRAQSKTERDQEYRMRQYHSASPIGMGSPGMGPGMGPVGSALLSTSSASSSYGGTPGCNLYIKYLDRSIDDDQLKALFEPHGSIVSAKVMTDDNGDSRGYGFVCFSSPDEAQAAIADMNGKEVNQNKLHVSIAQKKTVKRNNFMNPGPNGFGYAAGGPGAYNQLGYGIGNPLLNASIAAGRLRSMAPPSPGARAAAAAAAAAVASAGQNSAAAYAAYAAAAAASAAAAAASNQNPNLYPSEFSTGSLNQLAYLSQLQYPPLPPHLGGVPQYAAYSNSGSPLSSSKNSGTSTPEPLDLSGLSSVGPAGLRISPYFNSVTTPSASPIPSFSNLTLGGRPPLTAPPIGVPAMAIPNPSRPRSVNSNGSGSGRQKKSASSQSNGGGGRQNGGFQSKPREPIGGSSLSAAIASAANAEAEKEVIGEAVYRKVINHPAIKQQQEVAAKVTGMLLDQDKEDLLHWIDDAPTLDSVIQHAYDEYLQFKKSQQQDKSSEETGTSSSE